MINKHIWPKEYVKLSVKQDGEEETFQCDKNISEAIKIFNEKGYYTCNCCEGHPYKLVVSSGQNVSPTKQKKMDNTLYFEGGYIAFCDRSDRNIIFDLLNSKGDYFVDPPHFELSVNKATLEWCCIDHIAMSGKNMRYSSMAKITRLVYEDIWRIILETAKELPYKEIKNAK